ncbi:MAG TPA: D-alanine--D-alanine ligase [Bacteroidales bacterium]|jgi:D-alanine-D-alanine ligase|nr:D-alanine--D-alanine ligase [Bacteroidales bacterium]OQB60689.1 MAG: Vancomycin C-type resistance protein VanC [Bacteroidetes bacterium ADurb.Bin145]HOU01392.1 D-alanine--D-alanine ligase [Bacteroidales bacterium]HQG62106.1 D-alanine--D-alanine ligase [Bacteroidales bacterium]HQK68060.1 D-alanine--D-alanine ligase [Bacteroidales bacterium]
MRTIAIAAGGDSPEYEVSVKSAIEVSRALTPKYRVYIIIIRGSDWYWEDERGRYHKINKNDFTLVADDSRIRFDAVFIAIHGTPGENGLLQGYFDMLRIPYTSCDAFCSALTFNKQACKLFLKEYNIPMAEAVMIRKDDHSDLPAIIRHLGLPCFVKPNDSGSSFGVTKVSKKEELIAAVEKAFRESDEVMIEAFIKGREVACGVVRTRSRSLILPVTEIISKNEFFDYEAKYTPGRSEEITPAMIPAKISDEIQKLSLRIYNLLGCKGIVRVDFIIVEDKPVFLEINTVPGMSAESIIPKQARAAGIELADLYSMVIEDLFL